MTIHFGFVTQTVLVPQGCFSSCQTVLAQHLGLSCFSCCLTSKEGAGAQGVWRGHSWDSWPWL